MVSLASVNSASRWVKRCFQSKKNKGSLCGEGAISGQNSGVAQVRHIVDLRKGLGKRPFLKVIKKSPMCLGLLFPTSMGAVVIFVGASGMVGFGVFVCCLATAPVVENTEGGGLPVNGVLSMQFQIFLKAQPA